MSNPNEHNYMKKLLRLYQEGKLPHVSLELVDVYHDSWCAIHHGRFCDCDPDIKIRRRPFADPNRN